MRQRGVLSTRGVGKGLRSALVAVTAASVAVMVGVPAASAAGPDAQLELLRQQAASQVQLADDPTEQLMVTNLASASPDECYEAGQPYLPVQDDNGVLTCPDGRQLKVNQAYVWGMAKQADLLWYGTGPNIQCLAIAQYIMPVPITTDSFVCEGADSSYQQANSAQFDAWELELSTYLQTERGMSATDADADAEATIDRMGDWRPPDLFTYDLTTEELTNLNGELDPDSQTLLGRTVGIRSAGSVGDTVIFAGPDILNDSFGDWGWVNFFVFENGQFLGSAQVEGLTNIRKWVDIDGTLYTGVGVAPNVPDDDPTRGQVLKFTGSDAANPVQYEVVGNMTTSPSEFTEFEGRVYTSTWPAGLGGGTAGIFMSPPLNGGALETGDADNWDEVWNVTDYEPDPTIARTMAVGPVQSFDGKLFWGTMNVPFVGSFYLIQKYITVYKQEPSIQEVVLMLLGGSRTTTIFRGDGFDSSPDVDLLYGNTVLPVATFALPGQDTRVTWSLKRNKMKAIPRYGLAGFGNPFNAYTWTMAVNRGNLYVGTFDDSYVLRAIAGSLLQELQPVAGASQTEAAAASALFDKRAVAGMLEAYGLSVDDLPLQYGADLWRFPASDHRAVPEFINGADNRFSYGIRTMISDGTDMYLGMANPMNLEVPGGGWQLVQLSPWPTTTTLFTTPDDVSVGDPVTFHVAVRPEMVNRSLLTHGTPWGILRVYNADGNVLLGSCQVMQGRGAYCDMTTSGTHTFYATFNGTRTWADSVSDDIQVIVSPAAGGQQAPVQANGSVPTPSAAASTPLATTMQVGALSKAKSVKPQRTTKLVTSVQTNAGSVDVGVQCTVNGKVLRGKAARKACGLSVVKGATFTVSATPRCTSAARVRVSLTAQADGAAQATWSRVWSVGKKGRGCR